VTFLDVSKSHVLHHINKDPIPGKGQFEYDPSQQEAVDIEDEWIASAKAYVGP